MVGVIQAVSACIPIDGNVICLEDLSGIGYATNLDEIRVSMNNVETVPVEIGKLVNLRRLFIDNNILVSLPDSLGNLGNLLTIDVIFNRLSQESLSVLDLLPISTVRIVHSQDL